MIDERKRRERILTNLAIFIVFAILLPNTIPFFLLEEQFKDLLIKAVQGADVIKVKISDTSIIDLAAGRIKKVDIYGEGIRLKNVPKIESVTVTLIDLRGSRKGIKGAGDVDVIAVVTQDSLNDAIREKLERRPPIPELLLEKDGIKAHIRAPLGGVGSLVAIKGEILPKDGNKLVFVPGEIEIFNAKIKGLVLSLLSFKINPIIDLSSIKPKVVLKDFKIGRRYIRVTGKIEIVEPIAFH